MTSEEQPCPESPVSPAPDGDAPERSPNSGPPPYGWEFSTLRSSPVDPPGYAAHLELDPLTAGGEPVWVWMTEDEVKKLVRQGLRVLGIVP